MPKWIHNRKWCVLQVEGVRAASGSGARCKWRGCALQVEGVRAASGSGARCKWRRALQVEESCPLQVEGVPVEMEERCPL